jgi:hypothetical protein
MATTAGKYVSVGSIGDSDWGSDFILTDRLETNQRSLCLIGVEGSKRFTTEKLNNVRRHASAGLLGLNSPRTRPLNIEFFRGWRNMAEDDFVVYFCPEGRVAGEADQH